jgi:hypothetical protein
MSAQTPSVGGAGTLVPPKSHFAKQSNTHARRAQASLGRPHLPLFGQPCDGRYRKPGRYGPRGRTAANKKQQRRPTRCGGCLLSATVKSSASCQTQTNHTALAFYDGRVLSAQSAAQLRRCMGCPPIAVNEPFTRAAAATMHSIRNRRGGDRGWMRFGTPADGSRGWVRSEVPSLVVSAGHIAETDRKWSSVRLRANIDAAARHGARRHIKPFKISILRGYASFRGVPRRGG